MSLLAAAASVALIQMRNPGVFPAEMLRYHNTARAELNLQPLAWDEALADEAKSYAEQLARSGRFEHSHRAGEGENLWMGTELAYTYRQMVGSWTEEGGLYRSNIFPNVSTSGNWADVGHYTQVVWRDTTAVGCGLASGRGSEVLVCRYNPPGNVIGQWTFERTNPRMARSRWVGAR